MYSNKILQNKVYEKIKIHFVLQQFSGTISTMNKPLVNYAFIDAQNLHISLSREGIKADLKKFRRYLSEKYGVGKAYMFMGYIPQCKGLYRRMEKAGFTLIYKKILYPQQRKIKGNCDAEMVLQIMKDWENYQQAVVITGDGDFYCVIEHLHKYQKLRKILAPSIRSCSDLLKLFTKSWLAYINKVPKILQ